MVLRRLITSLAVGLALAVAAVTLAGAGPAVAGTFTVNYLAGGRGL